MYLFWAPNGPGRPVFGRCPYLFVVFVTEAFFGLKKASNWLVSLTKKDCRECKPSSKIDCRGVIHIVRVLFACYGVFGRACLLSVKYMCYGMASAQKEKNIDFLNCKSAKTQKKKDKRLNRVYPGRTTTYQGTLCTQTLHARTRPWHNTAQQTTETTWPRT